MKRNWHWAAAGVAGATGVAAAAWAAHGLSGNPTAQIWAETASRLQLVHAAALLGLGSIGTPALPRPCGRWLSAAGWLFVIGIILFCGTLYTLAVTGQAPFPGSAPLGGSSLIAGWLCLAVAGLIRRT